MNIIRRIFMLLITLSIMMMTACSGGDSSGDTPVVDDPAKSSEWDKIEWDKGQWG